MRYMSFVVGRRPAAAAGAVDHQRLRLDHLRQTAAAPAAAAASRSANSAASGEFASGVGTVICAAVRNPPRLVAGVHVVGRDAAELARLEDRDAGDRRRAWRRVLVARRAAAAPRPPPPASAAAAASAAAPRAGGTYPGGGSRRTERAAAVVRLVAARLRVADAPNTDPARPRSCSGPICDAT